MIISKNKNFFRALWRPLVNRMYKDTIFRLLFKDDKEALLELYNAINHSNYDNPDDLIINTLENAIFMGIKNDLSFIIDTHLNIYEHQSTKCPNMPLRCLFYVSTLYSQLIDQSLLYRRTKMNIYEPHFIMFYNGKEEMPERMTYKLSDLYMNKSENPDLELIVKVYNINRGMNTDLMKSCKKLEEYSLFVAKVREYANSMPMSKAIPKAIDYCIEHDILRDFLIKERKTIIMYSLFEYDQAEHMKDIAEVSRLEGIKEGLNTGHDNGVKDTTELFSWLKANGRSSDVLIAIDDSDFLSQLFAEYETWKKDNAQ